MHNSRSLLIKNAKFSGYYFHMNLNIQRNFQISISVPLTLKWKKVINSTLRGHSGFKVNKLSKPASIYLFKVHNKNTRKRREICSKDGKDAFLAFLVLTLNIFYTPFSSVSIVDLLCAKSIMLHPWNVLKITFITIITKRTHRP